MQKSNVEILKALGWLGPIRLRWGAKSEADPSFDETINGVSPFRIAREFVAWNIGYASWWDMFYPGFKKLCDEGKFKSDGILKDVVWIENREHSWVLITRGNTIPFTGMELAAELQRIYTEAGCIVHFQPAPPKITES